MFEITYKKIKVKDFKSSSIKIKINISIGNMKRFWIIATQFSYKHVHANGSLGMSRDLKINCYA